MAVFLYFNFFNVLWHIVLLTHNQLAEGSCREWQKLKEKSIIWSHNINGATDNNSDNSNSSSGRRGVRGPTLFLVYAFCSDKSNKGIMHCSKVQCLSFNNTSISAFYLKETTIKFCCEMWCLCCLESSNPISFCTDNILGSTNVSFFFCIAFF